MLIKVKVETGAKNEAVDAAGVDRLHVSVREKPEGNRANARVVTLLARHFGVAEQNVRIIRGHHKPSKLVDIFQ